MSLRRRQAGVTTVEFAIIGTVALIVLFGVIEMGRAVFVMNSLNETTRRAARMATVCPIDDPAIFEVAMFNPPGGGTATRFAPGLGPEHISLEYLDQSGDPITDTGANFLQIRYVRTRIVGYQHEMLIPYASQLLTAPEFGTTLRRESLGVPRAGAVWAC